MGSIVSSTVGSALLAGIFIALLGEKVVYLRKNRGKKRPAVRKVKDAALRVKSRAFLDLAKCFLSFFLPPCCARRSTACAMDSRTS